MNRLRLMAVGFLLGGCHLDTVPGPGLGAQVGPTPIYTLPTDVPAPVAVPGPPPRRPEREAPVCDDGQVAVPGQWDWVGEWSWCPAFCALGQAGYAYVAPVLENGVYLRGYYAPVEGAGPQVGLRPAYRRFVHPPDLVLGARAPGAPPPPAETPVAPAPPVYYGYGGYGGCYGAGCGRPIPDRARPRPQGTGERPPAPPRGQGERP